MINYMKNQNDTNRTYDTEGASQPKPSSHAEETQNGRKKKKKKKKKKSAACGLNMPRLRMLKNAGGCKKKFIRPGNR